MSLNGRKFFAGVAVIVIPSLLVYYFAKNSWSSKKVKNSEGSQHKTPISFEIRRVTVLYGTVTGTSRFFANSIVDRLNSLENKRVEASAIDLQEYNEDDLIKEDIVLLISCTWTDGTAPEKCGHFFEFLNDYAHDFRVSKDHFSKLTFSCFGLGSAYYGKNYAKIVCDAHENLEHLGASSLAPVARGDDQTDLEDKFELWSKKMVESIAELVGADARRNGTNKKDPTKGQVPANMPKLTGAEKADLLKKRKQTKLRVLERTNRGNSFQQQQVALGKGKAKTSMKHKKGKSEEGDAKTAPEPKEEEEEEEEEDRINNTFVGINDIDTHEKATESSCCGSNAGESGECGSAEKKEVSSSCCGGNGEGKGKAAKAGKISINPNLLPPEDDDDDNEDEDKAEAFHEQERQGTLDLEDLGVSIRATNERRQLEGSNTEKEPAAMVTKLQRKALTKEGYRIIGSHSAVKLCRWTKNQMRGRGGCYKHTFYGITSYQCMEATPSLACASKCVFCWRHHKNPVGTEWRWKEDDPSFIVEEAVELHRSMINEMRGVPGVIPERLAEGFNVKHCALSLVGEPIMYPRINDMLKELHDRRISSFMVTNAQFPEEVKNLDPVTQLYVSVDAATRDSLKAIDRPLFKDFWERFQGNLKNMKEKQQRTVYRLTLVSGWNMTEVDAYAELVELGTPDFIEIKAVTYCGKSDASTLTIENSPWHR